MRKYLLPEEGTFYKANLHSHSCLSDGKFTPEQMKEEYKKRGYSVLATTDHDALHCNYHLTEDNFLIITGYEISIRSDDDPTPHAYRKVVDLNLFAKDPYNVTQVGYNPDSVKWLIDRGKMTQEEVDAIKYAGGLRDMHYYVENVNKIIKCANENGFLACINHPMWSLANYNDFVNYEGAFAMEIYNHGCYALSGLTDSSVVFDDLLRAGKKIYCLATDDNHNGLPLNHVNSDSFGGFTMIKAKELSYPEVIRALESGEFYASTGPLIYDLYYENGYAYIKCSPVKDICLTTRGRRGERRAAYGNELITEAAFKIDPELYGYIRFTLMDHEGKRAYTNAYYVDDFLEKSGNL
ncbi:MAG: PHP domain-containing protein [Bacillota bacterium]|nr:PHP domain-containing protein [Bacillota bacterium]